MTEIEKFERELRLRRYARSTIETYTSCLKVLHERVSESFDIDKIKEYILTINKQNYHKQMVSTVRNYYKFVKGVELNLNDLPYPRKIETLPVVLSVEEVRKLIEYPKNLKHQVILCYLYSCGLRRSELVNLKLSDIDRTRMEIRIRQAKGFKDRFVPISQELLKLTEDYYKQYKPKEYLLNGQFSLQYCPETVNKVVKIYAGYCGLRKDVHAHTLRHCCGTHLHEMGVDLAIIQRNFGHRNIKTTDIYTRTSTAYRRTPSLLNTMNL